METGVIQIELIGGSIFRVVYLNSNQKKRIVESYTTIPKKVKKVTVVTNGLHTVSQWLDLCEILVEEKKVTYTFKDGEGEFIEIEEEENGEIPLPF